MSFETLRNIINFNKEQAEAHPQDKDLEDNLCPFDAWPLNINSEGYKGCPICGRIWR